MESRKIIAIVCAVIAIICFVAAFLIGGSGEGSSLSPALIGIIVGVSGAAAYKVLGKKDDK